jgi:hypothetical protein
MTRSKRKIIWDTVFLSLFSFSLVCFLLSLKGYYRPAKFSGIKPAELSGDEFDSTLMRLNSMAKLEAYCDSFFATKDTIRTYPGIVSEVIKKRFYHGYSYYDAYTNPVATFTAPLIKKGLAAVVLPDDILKYPFAACSQQSIVGTALLKRKGFKVREVRMFDTVVQGGHFAYEAFYSESWHYFDPNKEPDYEVLKKYNRPSVAYLNQHPEIVMAAYRTKNPEFFRRLLLSSKFSAVNNKTAPVATIFQIVTKYMNYFGWLLMGIFMLIRYRVLSRKPVSSFSWLRKGQAKSIQTLRPATLQGREARA